MNSFFSNRFQRMFSSDFQKRRKRTTSNVIDENTEPNIEGAAELAGSNSEDSHDKKLSEGNHLPNEEEQIKKNDTK